MRKEDSAVRIQAWRIALILAGISILLIPIHMRAPVLTRWIGQEAAFANYLMVLAAILLLTGDGKTAEKPVLICAEGSLVQKGRAYRPVLEALIREEIGGKLGRHAQLKIGQETTLPGSAAAILLNAK